MVGRPGTQWVPLDLVGGPRRGQLSRATRWRLDALAEDQLDDHLESIAVATRRRRHLLYTIDTSRMLAPGSSSPLDRPPAAHRDGTPKGQALEPAWDWPGLAQGGGGAFVECDRPWTHSDIDNGRLVCLIGVAAVRPA
jgi:hypothetical protein